MFTKQIKSTVFVKALAILTALVLCLMPVVSMADADDSTNGNLFITINEVGGASDAIFNMNITRDNASMAMRYTIDNVEYVYNDQTPIMLKAGQTAVFSISSGNCKIELVKIDGDTASTAVDVNKELSIDGNVLDLKVEDNTVYNVTFTRNYESQPTVEPTEEPTAEPTIEPTAKPTVAPTSEPTAEPTVAPTEVPTVVPTAAPTAEPQIKTGKLILSVYKEGDAADSGDKSFKYSITKDGKQVGDTITVKSGKSFEMELEEGTYTIKQVTPEIGCITSVKVSDGTTYKADATEFEIKADANTTIKFVNMYTSGSDADDTYDLKIKTVIKGDKADEDTDFVLTIKFDAEGKYKMSNGKKIKSGDTITLTGNDSITIYDLPDGTTYKVRQKKVDDAEYKTTYKNCSGKLNADTTARITNTWEEDGSIVKTGDTFNGQLPTMIMLLSALAAIGSGIALRRKFAK